MRFFRTQRFAILKYGKTINYFDGLDLEPADHVVSIGSAGDNALALLARGVASVSSVDLNPAQTCTL